MASLGPVTFSPQPLLLPALTLCSESQVSNSPRFPFAHVLLSVAFPAAENTLSFLPSLWPAPIHPQASAWMSPSGSLGQQPSLWQPARPPHHTFPSSVAIADVMVWAAHWV